MSCSNCCGLSYGVGFPTNSSMAPYCFSVMTNIRTEPFDGSADNIRRLCVSTESLPLQIRA